MAGTGKDRRIDRYEGAMLGTAVGDALGAPLEFMDAGMIAAGHGTVREMIGGGWLDVEPGEVTDDTQMMLAVAEGIVAEGDSTVAPFLLVGANFLRWFRTCPKDVGNTCAAVLSTMSRSDSIFLADWHEAAEKEYKATGGRTAGNGALMRTVYPGLWYTHTSEAGNMAVKIAQMTHWHEMSNKTVQAYTEAVSTIANSEISVQEAKTELERIMQNIRRESAKHDGELIQPTGYCLDSLVCALNAVRDTDSFKDALVVAVNLGGDADTIGAITGGLAGAVYGASEIPLRWINALNNQPNRKTVQMFHESTGEVAKGSINTLAIRLIELAHEAYRHHIEC